MTLVGCKDVMREISNYLNGDVDEAFKEELRTHLNKCQHCQVVFDTTRKTIELYCDGELFPLPDAVRTRLHAVIREKCQTRG